MAPVELLAELSRRGVELFREGDRLRYRAPAGALTPELRQTIADRKVELLGMLAPPVESCARIYSRHLDAELWIAANEEARRELERDLTAEGDARLVLTADEAMILGRVLEADAREIFATLAAVQRVMPGSRLREVMRTEDLDA